MKNQTKATQSVMITDKTPSRTSAVSKASLGRVPTYIHYLSGLSDNIEYISSASIAKDLGLGEVQVRKDLGMLCSQGRPKVGYVRKDLLKALESYMDTDCGNTVIVGAGKLGTALLEYKGFADYGLSIVGAFDLDPGRMTSAGPIHGLDELDSFCAEHDVQIGILTVPAGAAQSSFDRMYRAGIRAFLSFAPCRLEVPDDVIIHYEDLALSLSYLKIKIGKEQKND